MPSSADISLGISFENRKSRRLPQNLDEKHTNTSNEGLGIDNPSDNIVSKDSMSRYGTIMYFTLNAGD